MKLNNKIAVITGGNSGIGLTTAQTFISEGATVIIIGRNEQALDEAVRSLGEKATALQADVANIADLDRVFNAINNQYGRIDSCFSMLESHPLRP
jgi:NAD(P)-dependent dehydrogenase (short-subunit alcohol dehydrogenase family)